MTSHCCFSMILWRTEAEMADQPSWGKSLALDLYDCDQDRLTDEHRLRIFVRELIEVIGMVAHGPCYVDRFGTGTLWGLSAMQFIETSSVSVHLDDHGGRAFVDIFSCKDFDAAKARRFAQDFFGAGRIRAVMLKRGGRAERGERYEPEPRSRAHVAVRSSRLA